MIINVNSPSYSERDFDADDYGVAGLGSFTATTGTTFYKVWNDSLFLHMSVTGTVGASTKFIALDLPNSKTLAHGALQLPYCTIVNTLGNLEQLPLTSAGSQLLVRTEDLSDHTVGAISIYVNIELGINT